MRYYISGEQGYILHRYYQPYLTRRSAVNLLTPPKGPDDKRFIVVTEGLVLTFLRGAASPPKPIQPTQELLIVINKLICP